MDLSVKKTVGDIGLLSLPEKSQALWHPHTGRKLGIDVYTKTLPVLSQLDGFLQKEIDHILLQEGYKQIQVRIQNVT